MSDRLLVPLVGTRQRNGSVRRSWVVDGGRAGKYPEHKEQVSQRQKEPEEQRDIVAHEGDHDAHQCESRTGIDSPQRDLHSRSACLIRPPFFPRQYVLPQHDQRQGGQPKIRGEDDRGDTVSLIMTDQRGGIWSQRDEEQVGEATRIS